MGASTGPAGSTGSTGVSAGPEGSAGASAGSTGVSVSVSVSGVNSKYALNASAKSLRNWPLCSSLVFTPWWMNGATIWRVTFSSLGPDKNAATIGCIFSLRTSLSKYFRFLRSLMSMNAEGRYPRSTATAPATGPPPRRAPVIAESFASLPTSSGSTFLKKSSDFSRS